MFLMESLGRSWRLLYTGEMETITDMSMTSEYSRAILGKKNSVVVHLLSAGAGVDIPDLSGKTALHAACLAGDLEIVELVLHKTGDMQAKDKR